MAPGFLRHRLVEQESDWTDTGVRRSRTHESQKQGTHTRNKKGKPGATIGRNARMDPQDRPVVNTGTIRTVSTLNNDERDMIMGATETGLEAFIENLVHSLGGQVIRSSFAPSERCMIAFDSPEAASLFNRTMQGAMRDWQGRNAGLAEVARRPMVPAMIAA